MESPSFRWSSSSLSFFFASSSSLPIKHYTSHSSHAYLNSKNEDVAKPPTDAGEDNADHRHNQRKDQWNKTIYTASVLLPIASKQHPKAAFRRIDSGDCDDVGERIIRKSSITPRKMRSCGSKADGQDASNRLNNAVDEGLFRVEAPQRTGIGFGTHGSRVRVCLNGQVSVIDRGLNEVKFSTKKEHIIA